MSANGPGDIPASVRRRAARNRKPKPQTAAAAENARQVATGKVRDHGPTAKPKDAPRPSTRPPAYKPPVGDTKGDADRTRTTSARTKRGAAVAAYSSLTGKEKRARLAHAQANLKAGKGNADDAAILHIHKSRADRNAELKAGQATHDVLGNDDLETANAYKRTRPYLHILDDAKFAPGGVTGPDISRAGVGPVGVNKILAPLGHATKSTALFALDQLDRPVHAIAAAAKEDVKHVQEHGLGDYLLKGGGSKAIKAAGQGIQNKDKSTFSDVLDQAGVHNKWVKAIGGFTLDVALDPTTYLTLGVGVPAKVAAKTAEASVLRAGADAVKAGTMTQTELERRALHTAKEVYDAHPEHAKHAGVRIGARGTLMKATTGKRVALAAPVGSRVTNAARSALRAAATDAARAKGADVADAAGKQFVHDYRPRELHPLEHDYIRTAARQYRHDRKAGDRFAASRAHAIHAAVRHANLSDEDETTIIHAFEHGAIDRLPELHQVIARAIEHDLTTAGEAEVSAGIRQTLKKHHVPTDEDHARAAELTKAANIARARADGLRRSTKGADDFGQSASKAAEYDAQAAIHELEAEHLRTPSTGYFPRHIKDEVWDPEYQKFSSPSSTGGKVGGTSFKQRSRTEPISEMHPDDAADYDLRVAPNVGRRLQEHGRAMATAKLHDRIGALGRKIETPEELQHIVDKYPDAAERLLVRMPHGFQKLTDARGNIDHAKLAAAAKSGREIVEIPRAALQHADDLAGRGVSAAERKENVGLKAFDKVQGTVKTLQTAINPGYHGTNLVGDTFNFKLGHGSISTDLRRAGRLKWVQMGMEKAAHDLSPKDLARVEKAAKRTHKYGDETLTDAEFVKEAIDQGVPSGGLSHELGDLTGDAGLKKSSATARFVDWASTGKVTPQRGPMDLIRGASEHREDLVRLATYHGARSRGMSPAEAASWVDTHHFDYGDLTDAERGFMRRIIPFYTFMARNTRLQVSALGRAPGTYAAYGKARDELAKTAGQDPDFAETLQQYEQQGVPMMLPFKVGGNPVVLNTKLPLTDLNNLSLDPQVVGENLASRMSILAKVPVEQLFKLNTFTKKPYSHARVPGPAALANPLVRDQINAFFRQLGVDPAIKDIEDSRTGKMVPGWSWRIDELLRQIPSTNLAANVDTPTRSDHPQDSKLALIGYGLGPRPTILDPLKVKLNQDWDKHEQLDAEIKALKETVRHKSGTDWKGKIQKLSKQMGKLEVDIAKTSKQMGVSDPPFANRITKNKTRKHAAKAFGAAGGSAKPFGATTP